MAKFEVIVGSVLGASEYVADAIQDTLQSAAHQVTIHLQPDLADIDRDAIWIICTSTHGAGDLPDNIQPFADSLKGQQLSHLKYLIVGLGDSSYDTFCQGAMTMEALLNTCGAKLLKPAAHIDVLTHQIPEDKAVEYIQSWLDEK